MITEGHIELAKAGIVIGKDFSEQAFSESSLLSDSTILVHNGEYRSYSIGRHSIGGTLFAVSVFFEFESLKSVHLSPIDEAISSFENITDGVLERQAKENREWVIREFGAEPPLSFDWGKVGSTCDRKSWNALIVVSYGRI